MEQMERAKAARMLASGLNTARNIFADAEAIRSGFKPLSISTLKGWTKHKGCPVRLYIDGDYGNFYIGADESHRMRIELPEAFWNTLGRLPEISTALD